MSIIDFKCRNEYRKCTSNSSSYSFIGAVFADGRVCISILHAPGDDPLGYELSAERWSPVQSVEKILLSVVSMLAGKTCYFISYFEHLLATTIYFHKLINNDCLFDLQSRMTNPVQMSMQPSCGEINENNSTKLPKVL